MTGHLTNEQNKRMLERKDDVPKPGEPKRTAKPVRTPEHPEARQSQFPVSRQGMNEESRQQTKHNRPHKGA